MSEPEAPPAPVSARQFILEGIFHQLAKIIFLTWLLAWLLAKTSSSLLWNIPLAFLVVGAVHWASTQIDFRMRTEPEERRQRRTSSPLPCAPVRQQPPRISASGKGGEREEWRAMVGAPVVESAWEKLMNNIMQEFVYDSFWHRLTPDCEFPSEVRRLCNHVFGSLASRARKVDVRTMLLRDLTDLIIETLELYRDTRDSVGSATLEQMTPLARDRALRLEMRAEGNLHPALFSNDRHYEVLKQLSDGALGLLMDPQNRERPLVRTIVREIFSSALLKPAMQFLLPSFFNKTAVLFLEADYPELTQDEQVQRLQGEQMYEQRAAASAEAELECYSARMGKQKVSAIRGSPSDGNLQKLGAANRAPTAAAKASVAGSATSAPVSSSRGPSSSAEADAPRKPSVAVGRALSPAPAAEQGARKEAAPRSTYVAVADVTAVGGHTGGGAKVQQRQQGEAELEGGKPPRSPAHRADRQPLPVAPGLADQPSGSHEVPKRSSGRKRLEKTAVAFHGQPFTKVVAAELNAERRSREYVVFNIRCHDDAFEWTVLRRFRNFEQLHKRLRNAHGFGGSLPPKRYFGSSNSWEFVEERREQLDEYLRKVTKESALSTCPEMFEFLNPWSSAYALDGDVSLLNVVSNNLDNARHSVATRVSGGGGKPKLDGPSSPQPSKMTQPPAAMQAGDMGSPAPPPSNLAGPSIRAAQSVDDKDVMQPPFLQSVARSVSDGDLLRAEGQSSKSEADHPKADVLRNRETMSLSTEGQQQKAPELLSLAKVVADPAEPAVFPDSIPARPPSDSSLDEDSIGISRPLYLLVDAIFELQTHGFIWRQVTVVVKQMLSLVAGGTVDLFIAQKLHDVTSKHTIARLLLRTRNILWPGGIWFATARAQDLISKGKRPPASSVPDGGFKKNNWLRLEMEMGPDEQDMAARLKDILVNKGHPTLLRVVGRSRYHNAMTDVYNITQSPTYMMQLGHGILEIIFIHLMPELIPLLEEIRSPAAA